jgi:hypothetical protein
MTPKFIVEDVNFEGLSDHLDKDPHPNYRLVSVMADRDPGSPYVDDRYCKLVWELK